MKPGDTPSSQPRHGPRVESNDARRLRLASGLVLFVFVTTHLLNHALGLISLAAMEEGRRVFLAVWRNPVGTTLLLFAILIHLALAAWSIYLRRQLRMPFWEALQLILGLAIPIYLIGHVVGTGVANALYGYEDSYKMLLLVHWHLRPELALSQSVLLVIAWAHGCMGIHYWLRQNAWYPRVQMILYTIAVLLPVLALLGYAHAGQFVSALASDPDWIREVRAEARAPNPAAAAMLRELSDTLRLAFGALLALTLAARGVRQFRERSRSVRIAYPGNRVAIVPIGFSVLESSRQERIAHAAICGGRGRCSTCRVRIISGAGTLPLPSPAEARVLTRVGAGPNVRLACQLRPTHNLSVVPLIPPSVAAAESLEQPGVLSGQERELCVLFADLRGFTRLAENRLPYDVVFLLNRYFDAVGAAIESAGGVANQYVGDGVMALFGLNGGPRAGARNALAAALAMQRAMATLSAELHEAIPIALQLGIGIHCGPTVVGHMGRGAASYLTAVGDTVNTASRLQDETKQFACQLIISDRLAQLAGMDVSAFRREEISVRNRTSTIAIHIIENVESLELDPVNAPG